MAEINHGGSGLYADAGNGLKSMYKLFLCLRYLRSKVLALCAVFGVALCAFMMLVMVSVMSGFQDKIEKAAKGLFGDIVIEGNGERGIGWYDEFIAAIEKNVPEVQAADPFILSYGMLRVEDSPDFRQNVQIAGIRLPKELNKPSRADATDFENGLFVQKGERRPSFDPDLKKIQIKLDECRRQIRDILARDFNPQLEKIKDPAIRQECIDNASMAGYTFLQHKIEITPQQSTLLRHLVYGEAFVNDAQRNIEKAIKYQSLRENLEQQLGVARKKTNNETQIEEIEEKLDKVLEVTRMESPEYRVILGQGIQGLSARTEKGDTIRFMLPGHRIILYVLPLGKNLSMTDFAPNTHKFTIIDDNKADVSSIDSKMIYIPFETLQKLNNMDVEHDPETRQMTVPARCSQIHIKVRGDTNERRLEAIAAKIEDVWKNFSARYADKPFGLQPAPNGLMIQTWRQRQVNVVAPIESQRTLVIIITVIMSFVAIALIFVILYTIVVQKTREMGLLKAIGAGSMGVAGLFLRYGAAIAVIGSIAGIIGGAYFVRHINAVQDWVDGTFGFRVWSRETFMFEFIPDKVDWTAACWIFVGAIFAGLLGALLPAVRAGRMQPIEALRYE